MKSTKEFNSIHIENLLRQGEALQAIHELKISQYDKINYSQRYLFANLCRRVGLYQLGLKSLIDKKNKVLVSQDQHTLLEHSAILLEIGSVNEAKKELLNLDDEFYEKYYILALQSFKEWDESSALNYLIKYKAFVKTEYEILKLNINLALCYLGLNQLDLVKTTIDIIESTNYKKYKISNIHYLDIMAKYHLGISDFKNSKMYFSQFLELSINSKVKQILFSKKWIIYIKLKQGIELSTLLPDIKELEKAAIEFKEWETLRDLNKRVAIALKDEVRFNKVYYGTLNKNYRINLIKTAPEITLGNEFLYLPGGKIKKELTGIYNVQLGVYQNLILKTEHRIDSLPYKLLKILTQDFYSGLKIGHLSELLFTNEVFNPFSTPAKVFQVITRTRDILNEFKIPIVIEEYEGYYRLSSQENLGIIVKNPDLKKNFSDFTYSVELEKLSEVLTDKEFTAADLEQILNVSNRTAVRILKEGTQSNLVKVIWARNPKVFKLVG